MGKIKYIERLVEKALNENTATRGDNFILYTEVLKHFIDTDMSLRSVFNNHEILGIPSLETITRCRRKLQEQHPELRNPKVSGIRRSMEAEYIAYSRDEL